MDAIEAIEAIHGRRSIRAYLERPVTRELIEAVIWDAVQAPPPLAGQTPWVFNVIEGVAHIAALGARAKQYAADRNAGEWATRPGFDVFWGAPVVIVISGRTEDCCRAGENLMLSAHARGLGTCWVGSPMLWLQDASVKAELGIPAELAPVSALCLGYAEAVPPPAIRARPVIIWTADG